MTEWRRVWARGWHLELRISSLTRRVVSLDKELYSTLAHFSQVYKSVHVTYWLGGNPAMDWHPVQRGVTILLGMPHSKVTGISSGRLGLWLVCAFTNFILTDISVSYDTTPLLFELFLLVWVEAYNPEASNFPLCVKNHARVF